MLLGLPAVLLAVIGVGLLAYGEFERHALEDAYRVRVDQSEKEKALLSEDLLRAVRVVQATQGTESTNIDDYISKDDERRQLLAEVQEAEEIYLSKLNSLNPEEPEYLFKLALLSISRNQQRRGLAMMRQLAPMDEPGYVDAHFYLARYLTQLPADTQAEALRNVQAAERQLDNALLREPGNRQSLALKALINSRRNNLEGAYELYLKLLPDEPRVFRELVSINRRLKRPEWNRRILKDAEAAFLRNLDDYESLDDNRRIRVLAELTDCYQMQANFPAAESLLKSELDLFLAAEAELDPVELETAVLSRAVFVRRLLARIYSGWAMKLTEDNASEESQLEKLKLGFAQDSSNPYLQQQLTRLGFSTDASIEQAAKEIYDPEQETVLPSQVNNELGIQALSRSDYVQAREYFTIAKQQTPKNPQVLNNLAYTYLKCEPSNPRVALRLVNDAIRFTTNEQQKEKYETNFLDTRARALQQLGQWNAAIADYTKALQGREDNVSMLEAIIECCRANNMQAEADVWSERLEAARLKAASESVNDPAS